MIDWSPKDIEEILNSSFIALDCEEGFDHRELRCEFGGLQYLLVVCPKTELVWLRIDINESNSRRLVIHRLTGNKLYIWSVTK